MRFFAAIARDRRWYIIGARIEINETEFAIRSLVELCSLIWYRRPEDTDSTIARIDVIVERRAIVNVGTWKLLPVSYGRNNQKKKLIKIKPTNRNERLDLFDNVLGSSLRNTRRFNQLRPVCSSGALFTVVIETFDRARKSLSRGGKI